MRALLALLLVVAASAAETPRFDLEQLRAAAKEVAHLRIPFRQIKDLELFDQPVVTPGVMEISRPLASVRWEFTGRSVLVLRKDRLRRWSANGTEEHVRQGPATQALIGQMQAMLTGDWRALDKLFTVRLDPGGAPAIELRPRDEEMARYVTAISLRFNQQLSAPRELVITAPGGDTTRYEFDPPERPTELVDARFAGP